MRVRSAAWPLFLLVIALTGVFLLTQTGHGEALAASGTPRQGRSIVVMGKASTSSDPSAIVSLTVESRAADGGTAMEDDRRAVERVRASLQALGIASSDIVDGTYRLHPVTGAPTNGGKFLASAALDVTLDGKKSVGEVIDAAMRAGATSANGVYLEPRPVTGDQMRALVTKAVADARMKAKAVAQTYGVQLGAPEKISVLDEGPVNGPGGRPAWGLTVQVSYLF